MEIHQEIAQGNVKPGRHLVIVDDNSEAQVSGFPGSHGQASPLTALL